MNQNIDRINEQINKIGRYFKLARDIKVKKISFDLRLLRGEFVSVLELSGLNNDIEIFNNTPWPMEPV